MTIAQAEFFRSASFLGVLTFMSLWEFLAPRKDRVLSRKARWPSNIILIVLNNALLKILLPMSTLAFALHCEEKGVGVLNRVSWPDTARILAAIVLLDFIIYIQHVIFHFLPILWWLHRVHHADLDLDATSGIRFHPIEILISMGIKFSSIYILGVPPMAVIAFEIILNAMAMFNHSNVRIPPALDAVLRALVVTPDAHRVHHSTIIAETNSNFGFNLLLWDRLCGTYKAQPQLGHEKMKIGLGEFQTPDTAKLSWIYLSPFLQAVITERK